MFGGKLKTARKFTMKASTQVFVDYAPTNFSPDFKGSILGLSNIFHPSLEQDLSLKIKERDQTIWICILEL